MIFKPLQNRPPKEGFGFEQKRIFSMVRFPNPQDLLQKELFDKVHLVQTPLTRKTKKIK